MFDLVADVERYPEFVPLCDSLVVRSRAPAVDGIQTLVATMMVGYGPVHESLTTRVRLDRANMRITTSNVDGPFRHLENQWLFHHHPDGCRVAFSIEYAFRGFALEALVGSVFDRAFRKFAQAFEARADMVYRSPGGAPVTQT